MDGYRQPAYAWRPLALSSEVGGDRPIAKRIADQQYAVFRDAQGVVRALEDRCAHRRAPLSLGRVSAEGWLQCPYHGWCYEGGSGKCAKIPNLAPNESIPGPYAVAHFATLECDGMVFLGLGDAAHAAEAQVPAIALPAGVAQGEGSCLLTLPSEDFAATLLDGPSLLLESGELLFVDNHLLGVPRWDEDAFVVERVADWRPLAESRPHAPGNYPVLVRTRLAADGLAAQIDLIEDETRTRLLTVALYLAPVSHCVTAAFWRWTSGSERIVAAPELAWIPGIRVKPTVDADTLVQLRPYASTLWRQAAAARQEGVGRSFTSTTAR